MSVVCIKDVGYTWSNYTPLGCDGHPKPVWDLATGKIDREVVECLRKQNFDLREYLERNWPALGPYFAGKLHFYCGDEDGGYFNLALYLLEDFLQNTENPHYGGSFTCGRTSRATGGSRMKRRVVRIMAEHVQEAYVE